MHVYQLKLHNTGLHNLYASLGNNWVIWSRRIIFVEHVACMVEMRHVYKIVVLITKWNTTLRETRHRFWGWY